MKLGRGFAPTVLAQSRQEAISAMVVESTT
jgi:hypothetical protein